MSPPIYAIFIREKPEKIHGLQQDSNHSITVPANDFTWTFDIHEVAVGALYKPFEFVFPFLFLNSGMQKIFEQLKKKL